MKETTVKDSYDQETAHVKDILHVYPDFDFITLYNGVVIGIDSEQICIYKNETDYEDLKPTRAMTYEQLHSFDDEEKVA